MLLVLFIITPTKVLSLYLYCQVLVIEHPLNSLFHEEKTEIQLRAHPLEKHMAPSSYLSDPDDIGIETLLC